MAEKQKRLLVSLGSIEDVTCPPESDFINVDVYENTKILYYTDGTESPIRIAPNANHSGSGTPTGDDSAVYPDCMVKGVLYNNNGSTSDSVISGLDITKTYKLIVFASEDMAAGERDIEFTVDNISYIIHAAPNNYTETASWENIQPDENGHITVSWRNINPTYGVWNCFELIEESQTPSESSLYWNGMQVQGFHVDGIQYDNVFVDGIQVIGGTTQELGVANALPETQPTGGNNGD